MDENGIIINNKLELEKVLDKDLKLSLRINARMHPIHFDDYYVKKINRHLVRYGMGRVTSSETTRSDNGEIVSCVMDLYIAHTPKHGDMLIEILKFVQLPKGSTLHYVGKVYEGFGTLEGLAVYVNTQDAKFDEHSYHRFDELVDELLGHLGDTVIVHSLSEFDSELAFYFYGENMDDMTDSLKPFLNEHSLREKCRVTQIT